MPLDTRQRKFSPHVVWLVVLLIALQVRDVAKAVGLPIPKIPVPYGGGIADNLLSVVVVLVASALLCPGTPGEIAARLGLRWSGLRGPALTLLATLPCWLGLWTQSTSVGTGDLLGLLWLALLFPLAEEIVFRGFGFVFACRALAWRPAIAALVQAVVFGGVHWFGAGGGGGDALFDLRHHRHRRAAVCHCGRAGRLHDLERLGAACLAQCGLDGLCGVRFGRQWLARHGIAAVCRIPGDGIAAAVCNAASLAACRRCKLARSSLRHSGVRR
ncbi:CPBP family glutamic-type intramembrane protease [Xanthomonas campestris]|uniref:CPBP family glutamic-type intramembrane protease n=1 Tax=Xanthomonas campestris TaxID=339 RepID=UPI00237988AE|nr:CPBP family glutamic-type intramembrane protease [Xanthomonas campestris]